jgi:hypothetical protein
MSDFGDAATVSAKLTAADGGSPVAGEAIAFVLGDGTGTETCTGTTDATGVASCSIAPNQVPGPYILAASFAGSSAYQASNDSQPFTVTKEETTLQITSSPTEAAGSVVVKAKLLEDGQTPIGGRTVTFSAGNASAGGTTDSAGIAGATLALQPGQYALSASFRGDPLYLASNAPGQTLYVYQPSQFVIWGGNPPVPAGLPANLTIGMDRVFWGAQWAKQVQGGNFQAGSSFKGHADQVGGATWTSTPGNSSNPPSSVANYIGVIVSTQIAKKGNVISGNVAETAILKVDNPAGYQPDPGYSGTGVLVAVVR